MSSYPIFSVMGLEIEYMLVNKDTLSVQPQSDVILNILAGQQANEVVMGEIAASNELVMHVLELKNHGPKPVGEPIAQQFQQTILALQPVLNQHHLQLLPTGAHPWMDPLLETKRWPHGDNSIYKQFDTIFDCRGHGWANLQSMHVNLPFANDNEFCQLHNTIRLLLPLMPALAASTPLVGAKPTGLLCSRLDYYGKNQQRIPSISGDVIPEFIRTKAQYQDEILSPMYRDISEYDPEGLLQHEWLNSRAAIAKFNSMAVEIRILDTQECVNADIAIAQAIHAILKSWYDSGSTRYLDKICDTQQLKTIYNQTIKNGLNVVIKDMDVLEQWQLPKRSMTARDAWALLIERVSSELDKPSQRALEHILSHGNLSERILRACGRDLSQDKVTQVYRELGGCLLKNQQFQS